MSKSKITLKVLLNHTTVLEPTPPPKDYLQKMRREAFEFPVYLGILK